MRELIIVYIIIFAIALVYTISYLIYEKFYNRRVIHDLKVLVKIKNKVIKNIDNPRVIKRSIRSLKHKLQNKRYLIAFDRFINSEISEDELNKFMFEISPVFGYIIKKYKSQNDIYKAYLCYLLSEFSVNIENKNSILNFLVEECSSNSIYCSMIAIGGLVKIGDSNSIIDGFLVLSKKENMLQPKLVTEVLNSFKGDKIVLSDKLMENFDGFCEYVKVGIVNFLKENTEKYSNRLLMILQNESSIELKYAILRYYGKNKYDLALDYLLSLGNIYYDAKEWGYVSVICYALRIYDKAKVKDFLLKCCCSPNWEARERACQSIIFMFNDESINMVDNLNDKFASEMIRYQLSSVGGNNNGNI